MISCYFGIYDANYNRNKILMRGLRARGFEIVECVSRRRGLAKYIDLIKQHRTLNGKYDAMIVGFPGYQAMILARFLTNKPIFFDAFFSFYDAMVLDRRLVSRYSPRALYFWLLDWFSCFLADKVLLDTNEHIEYFCAAFGLKPEKCIRIFIGADTDIYLPVYPDYNLGGGVPSKEPGENFIIHFHGSFIPSQGIDYILDAAAKLKDENIIFNIVGKGNSFLRVKERAEDLNLGEKFIMRGFLPLVDLLSSIKNADLCLGIFGATARTGRIIPNKIFECLAMRKALLTSDSPAVRELFSEKEMMFCRAADGADLAEKILFLKNNPDFRNSLAENGYDFFAAKLKPADLVSDLSEQIKTLVERNKAG